MQHGPGSTLEVEMGDQKLTALPSTLLSITRASLLPSGMFLQALRKSLLVMLKA